MEEVQAMKPMCYRETETGVEPCDMKALAGIDRAKSRILDEIGGVKVSTVFLGLDHRFSDSLEDGPPVLWETMIFGGAHDEHQERYTSRADAIAGHARAVKMVKGE